MRPTGFFLGRISQPLSGICRTRLNLKALEFSTELAQQKVRSKREDVVRNVKQLYYNIEQTQSSLVAARETVRLYKEVERVTDEYVLKQTALESQLLQAQANLADAEQSELKLSNQEASEKEQLNDLLGRDVLTPFSVAEISSARVMEVDLVTARQQALRQRPEIQQARLKTLQSKQEVRARHSSNQVGAQVPSPDCLILRPALNRITGPCRDIYSAVTSVTEGIRLNYDCPQSNNGFLRQIVSVGID